MCTCTSYVTCDCLWIIIGKRRPVFGRLLTADILGEFFYFSRKSIISNPLHVIRYRQNTYRRQKLSNLLKLAINTSPPEHALREKKTCVAASLQTCIQLILKNIE